MPGVSHALAGSGTAWQRRSQSTSPPLMVARLRLVRPPENPRRKRTAQAYERRTSPADGGRVGVARGKPVRRKWGLLSLVKKPRRAGYGDGTNVKSGERHNICNL